MEPQMIIESIYSRGAEIALVGYLIVFFALVILYYAFSNVSKILLYRNKRKLQKENKIQEGKGDEVVVSGEVSAAISMAIYLCRDLHDDESDVITIKRVSKTYSPWSSKIYGVRFFQK